MKKKIATAAAAAVLAATLSGGPASAALEVGSGGADILTGTHSADLINGRGGNDTLRGLAADDVYHFDDGFGNDALVEVAKHKVGKKTVPGGKDSLNLSAVSSGVHAYLTPEWPASGDYYGNQAFTQDTNAVKHRVSLGTSPVEGVTGGSGGFDFIGGGGAANTLRPGGGVNNQLRDFGGWTGGQGLPAIPNASSDAYSGFGALPAGGRAEVADWGGDADRLVLPGVSSDYYVDAVNVDVGNPAEESLQVYDPTNNTSVIVYGHFSAYGSWTSEFGMHGRIEQLQFADGSFDAGRAQSLGTRLVGGTALGGAEEAKRAAEKARSDAATDPTRPAMAQHRGKGAGGA